MKIGDGTELFVVVDENGRVMSGEEGFLICESKSAARLYRRVWGKGEKWEIVPAFLVGKSKT